MARTRTIDTDALLDAVERVVLRVGVVGLSIDAVAVEAGISKSRVVYDYKTKDALIAAFVDRYLQRDRVAIDNALEEYRESPEPEIYARLAVADRPMDEHDQAVSIAISAAMTADGEVTRRLRDAVSREISTVREKLKQPETGFLAFLALNALMFYECLGLYKWSADERAAICDQIKTLAVTDPACLKDSIT